MSDEKWSLVDVCIESDLVEIVSDALWSFGVVAIEEIAAGEGRTILRTSMGDDPTEFVSRVRSHFPHADVEVSEHDRAVADTWREFAEPTWVTDSIALVPAWREAPPKSTAIFVEPLDTFGLGNHPTTVLTLRLALKHVDRQSVLFDFGSGSGVLSVGLSKITGCRALAYDIADSARTALEQNMVSNEVTTCEWVNGFPDTTVDVVVANILAPVLESESSAISHALKLGGVVVLSGMRLEQCDRVLEHYEEFIELERESMDGWCAVALRKQ